MLFRLIKYGFPVWLILSLLAACSDTGKPAELTTEETHKRIAVLLVNHGSRSKKWRNMLTDVDTAVREELLTNPKIGDVKTAFMEYTEPSIATQMRAFDEAGYDEVVVIPLLLTVSSHSLNDIPNILGIQSNPKVVETLAKEKIEIYRAKARVHFTYA